MSAPRRVFDQAELPKAAYGDRHIGLRKTQGCADLAL